MIKSRKLSLAIHGHYDEMTEFFDYTDFQPDNDLLISLGDLVDKGPDPMNVIEKLMEVKNFIHILGNHDDWCYQYLKTGNIPFEWISQGRDITLNAYRNTPSLKEKHNHFFEKSKTYFIDESSRLFVHGGYNPRIPFNKQTTDKGRLIWDRSLTLAAIEYDQHNQLFSEFYDEVFIGHTTTLSFKTPEPKRISNLWIPDTGVYPSGRLTLISIETMLAIFMQINYKPKYYE